MTQFTRKTALVILTVAVIAGCKKDDNSSPSKTQLLTSGSWKLTAANADPAIDINQDGVVENDIFAVLPTCFKDNLFIFKTNNTYVVDEGATKCNVSDPQIMESSNWKFSDNESNIMIGDPGSETIAQLLELSSTVLKMKIVVTDGSYTLTETLTYGH